MIKNKNILLLWVALLSSSFFCNAEKVGNTPSLLLMQGGIGMQIDVENVEKGVPFNVFVDWIGNTSYDTGQNFFGSLALALIAEDGEIKQLIHEEPDVNLYPGWGFGQSQRFYSVTVDTDITSTDIIRFITRENGATNWLPVTSNECEITYCPVKGNKVHVADVIVNVLGNNDIPFNAYCENTRGVARQDKAVYSSAYNIAIQWPEGKDHRFVNVTPSMDRIQIDPDRILIQMVDKPEYRITIMACADEELITEQLHFTVNTPGTLADQLKDNENLIYINNISVSGPLDDSDFEFMRDKMPMLEHIDLSDASISNDYLPDKAFESKRIKSLILPETLKALGYNSLCGTKLFKLDIPKGVSYYGLNALNYSEDLTLLVLRNPDVIPVSWCVLEGTNRSKGVLFVPEGAKEAFAADSEWGQFGLIVEGDNTDDWVYDSDDTYSYTGLYPDVVITKVNNPAEEMIIPETVELNGRTFNVTGIGERTFASYLIQKIRIPKSIIKLGEYAIESYGCTSLIEIDVDEDNPVYFSHDGVLYQRTTQTMLVYPRSKNKKEYEVPEGVIGIGGWASYNYYLEKIVFPSSLQYIESCAFCYSGLQYNENPVIISKAETPPYLSQSAFSNETFTSAYVYVPTNSLETYKRDNSWGAFYNILSLEDYEAGCEIESEDMPISVIGKTLTVTSEYPVEIYSIDGKLLYNATIGSIVLPDGLYIIRINGKTRKIRI